MATESRSEVGIDVALGEEPAPSAPRQDTPFCLLIIGDFAGGAATRGALHDRRPVPFDRDDVDAAVARVRPEIRLSPGGAPPFTLHFSSIDDFHPDRLFVEVPLFASLRELRARLSNPRTFAAAVRELAGADDKTGAAVDAATIPAPETPGAAAGSLLDQMLDTAEGTGSGSEPGAGGSAGGRPSGAGGVAVTDDLAAYLREIVRPHVVAGPDPRQAELVAGVDATLASQMRGLLHEPAFQTLESLWRTVDRLAVRIETGTSLRLYLVDVGEAELDAALDDDDGVRSLRDLLARTARQLPEDGRWSALIVARRFGASEADDRRLAALAGIGRSLGTAVLADASPALAGRATWAELPDPREWTPRDSPTLTELRASPAAAWLCLAAPRVLLRAPYGQDGEPLDSFDFEEADDDAGHDAFLWGSGAAVCALLLANSFSSRGWAMRPGVVGELDRIPIHLLRRDGETVILPGAETLLTEHAADRMMALGITPIATLRDTGTVRVVRFQSFASPPTALVGPWTAGASA